MATVTGTFADGHPLHDLVQMMVDNATLINQQAQQIAELQAQPTPTPAPAPAHIPKFYAVLERAFYYMGKNIPYKFGAEMSDTEVAELEHMSAAEIKDKLGFDCSSFMQRIFADCGIKIHRLAGSQLGDGIEVDMTDESKWKPGMLLIFKFKNATTTASHVGMYLGNGLIIHTATPDTGIIVRRWKDYYANDLIGVRRILT